MDGKGAVFGGYTDSARSPQKGLYIRFLAQFYSFMTTKLNKWLKKWQQRVTNRFT